MFLHDNTDIMLHTSRTKSLLHTTALTSNTHLLLIAGRNTNTTTTLKPKGTKDPIKWNATRNQIEKEEYNKEPNCTIRFN